ncbi:MAG TPA: penicillin-binding transpeptidase domain-containing protein [Anaerolineales bacterium]|nr:penicillin-binding transpeptidase domain-containing protein [Anaerolineales bacterium]
MAEGTAEDPGLSGVQEPDAWFTGFTYAGRSDRPDIAFAVVVQNQGQGSDFAAPIARRIIEAYFGLNYARYPWEASVGVPADLIATPTPDPSVPVDTPTP